MRIQANHPLRNYPSAKTSGPKLGIVEGINFSDTTSRPLTKFHTPVGSNAPYVLSCMTSSALFLIESRCGGSPVVQSSGLLPSSRIDLSLSQDRIHSHQPCEIEHLRKKYRTSACAISMLSSQRKFVRWSVPRIASRSAQKSLLALQLQTALTWRYPHLTTPVLRSGEGHVSSCSMRGLHVCKVSI